MRKFTPDNIVNLKENEVFVFGSNSTGFHGGGAAGLAFRGQLKNNWRDDDLFAKAMKSYIGSPDRIGKWAIYGVARGFQKGTEGSSYAIETIRRPGDLRSTPLIEIEDQIKELVLFAKQHPELDFLTTKIGSALAGYSIQEIRLVFENVKDIPDNIILPFEYEFRL